MTATALQLSISNVFGLRPWQTTDGAAIGEAIDLVLSQVADLLNGILLAQDGGLDRDQADAGIKASIALLMTVDPHLTLLSKMAAKA